MNLNVILPIKKINVNTKTISIPKLGLKHHNIMKDVKGPGENLCLLLDSICPGLSQAESDLVVLHLLAFNGKLKETVIKDGFTYNINDAYICQRLVQRLDGNEFKFRAQERYSTLSTVDDILSTYLESVNGEKVKVDFMKLPAFVVKWADDLVNTIAIPGPNGPIKGILKVMEIFE
ncbi:baseplate hub protein [Klebsiella phage Metamorpho]|nr:baseplate hub protein [Klebsiella phage Metamorpho]